MPDQELPARPAVMDLTSARDRLADLLRTLPPRPLIGVGGTALAGKPMALLRLLCDLGLPAADVLSYAAGIDAELLLAFDRVATLRCAYLGLEGVGKLPAREELEGRFVPETFGSIIWGLEATTRGLTFMPGTDLSGTGLAAERPLTQIACPFTGRTFTAWPAIRPHLSVLHARAVTADGFLLADADLGVDRLLAKASAALLVSVETIEPEVAEPAKRGLALIVPAVDPIVVLAPGGARPGGYGLAYPADDEALARYASLPDHPSRRAWWLR
jgi:acyl CoA:acetate/3-ketoacid CoA transferase alpha subunit